MKFKFFFPEVKYDAMPLKLSFFFFFFLFFLFFFLWPSFFFFCKPCQWWCSSAEPLRCEITTSLPLFTSPLTWSKSTCYGPVYGSNKFVWKLLVLSRNSWNHITVCRLFVLRIFEAILVYYYYYYLSPLKVFHTSVSWWTFTGVWSF